jgi:hypothetical protein
MLPAIYRDGLNPTDMDARFACNSKLSKLLTDPRPMGIGECLKLVELRLD